MRGGWWGLPALALACGEAPPDLELLNDIVPPEVQTVRPPNGVDNVPTSATVEVTFTESINVATVTAESFRLMRGTEPVQAERSAGGATATLRPILPLDLGTTYTATIGPGVADRAGNRLNTAFTWSFTTGTGVLRDPS